MTLQKIAQLLVFSLFLVAPYAGIPGPFSFVGAHAVPDAFPDESALHFGRHAECTTACRDRQLPRKAPRNDPGKLLKKRQPACKR